MPVHSRRWRPGFAPPELVMCGEEVARDGKREDETRPIIIKTAVNLGDRLARFAVCNVRHSARPSRWSCQVCQFVLRSGSGGYRTHPCSRFRLRAHFLSILGSIYLLRVTPVCLDHRRKQIAGLAGNLDQVDMMMEAPSTHSGRHAHLCATLRHHLATAPIASFAEGRSFAAPFRSG